MTDRQTLRTRDVVAGHALFVLGTFLAVYWTGRVITGASSSPWPGVFWGFVALGSHAALDLCDAWGGQ